MIDRLLQKIRWHVNEWMLRHLGLLSFARARFTILDAFGAPGDSLLAATVCRIIKKRYPGLRINLRTQWPELVRHDPCLDLVNGPESYFTLRFWYVETVARKEQNANVLLETLAKVGVTKYAFHSKVHLLPEEVKTAGTWLSGPLQDARPRLAFCSLSKEKVKNWPESRWKEVLDRLAPDWNLIHLGDEREPVFDTVQRFAGNLSMRDSMAVLSCCDAFVGPDSFLMHAANGLDIPSVILFGGSRPPDCLGYAENINLFVPMPCGPCWLHDTHGDFCPYEIACMHKISVEEVVRAVRGQVSRSRCAEVIRPEGSSLLQVKPI